MIAGLFEVNNDATSKWKATHMKAKASVDGENFFDVGVALFDTGASDENYISTTVIKEHGLQELVESASSSVRVADGRVIQITGKIKLHLKFVDEGGNPNEAALTLMVLEGLSLSLVIGISSIMTHFKDLFIEMISQVKGKENDLMLLTEAEMTSVEVAKQSDFQPEVETEEEELIPNPESFPGCWSFLERTTEAEEEYHSNVVNNVSEEFAAHQGVMDFLHSEIAVRVFVPDNWEGINGVEPLKLNFSEEMPKRIKPAARPIPPRMVESTKKEFDRMKTYFYAPSNSPIASPLVVAKKATAPYIRICGDYREFPSKSSFPRQVHTNSSKLRCNIRILSS
jgi:hypothetical protein